MIQAKLRVHDFLKAAVIGEISRLISSKEHLTDVAYFMELTDLSFKLKGIKGEVMVLSNRVKDDGAP